MINSEFNSTSECLNLVSEGVSDLKTGLIRLHSLTHSFECHRRSMAQRRFLLQGARHAVNGTIHGEGKCARVDFLEIKNIVGALLLSCFLQSIGTGSSHVWFRVPPRLGRDGALLRSTVSLGEGRDGASGGAIPN